jgi:hypothetical protein
VISVSWYCGGEGNVGTVPEECIVVSAAENYLTHSSTSHG